MPNIHPRFHPRPVRSGLSRDEHMEKLRLLWLDAISGDEKAATLHKEAIAIAKKEGKLE